MKLLVKIVLIITFSVSSFSQNNKKITTFTFEHNSRDQVYLSGDFNNWNPKSHPMYRKNGKWHLSIELTEGYHYYCFNTKTKTMPDPKHPFIIDDKKNNFISEILVGENYKALRFNSEIKIPEVHFSKLIYENNPSLEVLYNHSQKLLFDYFYSFFSKLEVFEHQHSPLLALTASYFPEVIPVGKYLDSFYEAEYEIYTNVDNALNCAFLPYCEFRYFQITGDDSRLKTIFPKLLRKYDLLFRYVNEENKKPETMFHPTNENEIKYSPLFLRSMQALYIRYVAVIAGIIGDEANTKTYVSKLVTLTDYINDKFLNKNSLKYIDRWKNFKTSDKFHSGFLATILAEVCPKYSLKSAKIAFSRADYFYPIYNYLYCCGLQYYQQSELSNQIAAETIHKITDIYNNTIPLEEHLNKNEVFKDAYQTFWNSYSAVVNSPMIYDDSQLYANQDFALTAGPGFFNNLIEHFLGIEFAGNENKIRWNVNSEEKQGIKNISFRDQKIDLIISKSEIGWFLEAKCKTPFELELKIEDKVYSKIIEPGLNNLIIE